MTMHTRIGTSVYLCMLFLGVWLPQGKCHLDDVFNSDGFKSQEDLSGGITSKLQALELFLNRLQRYSDVISHGADDESPRLLSTHDLPPPDQPSYDDVILSDVGPQYGTPVKRGGETYGQPGATGRDTNGYGSQSKDMLHRNYLTKRYSPYHYIRGRSCDFTRLTADHLLEYFRSGKICGRRVSHMRFGLTGRK